MSPWARRALVATAVFTGGGFGTFFFFVPSDQQSLLGENLPVFGFGAVVQAIVGWMALRAVDDPKRSVLADLVRDTASLQGLELDPKPLLGLLAFVLFFLSSLIGMAVAAELSRPAG